MSALLYFLLLSTTGCATMNKIDCKATTLKVSQEAFELEYSRYGSGNSEKSILIMPPTGGAGFYDTKFAERFCSKGFDAYVLNNWTGYDEKSIDPGLHQRLFSSAQSAIDLLVSHIQSASISIFGTSVGGLHATVAVEKTPRIRAAFVVAAGLSIPEVIVRSDLKSLKKLSQERKEKLGLKTDEDVQRAIETEFELDPLSLENKHQGKALGMVILNRDKTVPTDTQIRLREHWNPQVAIEIDSDHFWGIARTWLFEVDTIVNFFEQAQPKK